ncbi:MAG: hypothetical protein CVT62_02270 [Actinobacteria bacterium HGW-Actinobacteria-2]|nr:MAG: hypothetical protein CVT62_02270 [Actinobacteria bacterium HGW-Actinobacteria-2]
MEPQIPTGYENYPRPEEAERQARASGWENPPPPTPIIRSYQGSGAYQPSAPQGSRRSLLAGVIGIGVVSVVGYGMFNNSASSDQTIDGSEYDPGQYEDPSGDVLAIGGDIALPEGWTAEADTDTEALLTTGRNRILLSVVDATSDAETELRVALARSDAEFTGTLSKPRQSVRPAYTRVSVSGTGKYKGVKARQLAEVLVADDDSRVLFIQQILTAGENSMISDQATQLAADLRDSWPW